MEILNAKLVGTAPLLLHNSRLANPFDKWTIAIKEITSKRKKTEDDAMQLYWLEWCGSMYMDKPTTPDDAMTAVVKPVIPAANILSFINDGARHFKRGQDVWRGVFLTFVNAPIQDSGWSDKKTLRQMYDMGSFRDVRSVVVNNSRCMRSRPIFNEWSVPFELTYDPELLNRSDLVQFIERAARYNGLCDGKPLFGRCKAEIL